MGRFLRFLLLILLVLLLLGGSAWVTAPRWLPDVAGYLVTEDSLAPSDLIVVLSGSATDRGRFGADLHRKRYAPRILCASSLLLADLEALGKRMTHAELSAAVLRREGVPEDDIIVINRSTSTFEELQVVRDTMLARGWKRVILVSSPYHLRRMRFTWEHVTRGTGLKAILAATPYSKFHRDTWWRHEADLLTVQNEYAKLLYYRLLLFRGLSLEESTGAEAPRPDPTGKKHRGVSAAMQTPA